MKYPLRKDQVFRTDRFAQLVGDIKFDPTSGEPFVDWTILEVPDLFDICGGGERLVSWMEKKDNWFRHRETKLNFLLEDSSLAQKNFVVKEVSVSGGGTGHGAHDILPDGHYVLAQEVDGDRVVAFYQDLGFRGKVMPEEIELISGPEDKAVKLKSKVIWREDEQS